MTLPPDPVLDAFNIFREYSEAAESLVHLTYRGLQFAVQSPGINAIVLKPDAVRDARSKWEAEQAQKEIDSQYSNLHAHSLMGLCGALESLIDDVVIAALRIDPSHLNSQAFTKVKLPVGILLTENEEEKFAAIVNEAARATSSDLATGVGKYERLLALVSLDGRIPKKVSHSIYIAQQIRNIWAHKGGRADRKFVDSAPHLGFAVGDKVKMTVQMFQPLMHATHMYGLVVMNRHLKAVGQRPLFAECHGYHGCLAELGITADQDSQA